jgi:sec-independent protein translocase protein TatA
MTMIGSLGWQELLIILVILALLFGASRVSDLGGALGRGIREFRSEASGDDSEGDDDDSEEPAAATSDSDFTKTDG